MSVYTGSRGPRILIQSIRRGGFLEVKIRGSKSPLGYCFMGGQLLFSCLRASAVKEARVLSEYLLKTVEESSEITDDSWNLDHFT